MEAFSECGMYFCHPLWVTLKTFLSVHMFIAMCAFSRHLISHMHESSIGYTLWYVHFVVDVYIVHSLTSSTPIHVHICRYIL